MKPRICAIVMPHGSGEPSRLAYEVLAPVLETLGLIPYRIDPGELALAGAGAACEHFVLADEALIDAASLSGLAWYHLGVRETVRPSSTVALAREGVLKHFAQAGRHRPHRRLLHVAGDVGCGEAFVDLLPREVDVGAVPEYGSDHRQAISRDGP